MLDFSRVMLFLSDIILLLFIDLRIKLQVTIHFKNRIISKKKRNYHELFVT
jgi:hypothetical protein